jgi:hypothetical protein
MPTSHTLIILRRRALHTLAAISFLSSTLFVTASPALAQTEARGSSQDVNDPIEGSWICKIDRIAQGDSFTALTSFTAGGVVVATGSMDKVNPVSPVYGSWKRIGSDRVSVAIYFFLFDPIGNPVGMLKTDEIFHLNGRNQLSGAGSSFVCDVDGQNCSNHGTEALIAITGERIVP